MRSENLYSSAEVATILGIGANAVWLYYKKYNIGIKKGRTLLFTRADIEEISNTDGRRK